MPAKLSLVPAVKVRNVASVQNAGGAFEANTVTVNLHSSTLPAHSMAVQVTVVVVPGWKGGPLGGLQVTTGAVLQHALKAAAA